mmetsp:Transcript_18259/g.8492  ORF Transcript_18259/g.8492 Transcript_18259/m.8492 type:complete len:86 (-) Transcript_18259:139-396(-)
MPKIRLRCIGGELKDQVFEYTSTAKQEYTIGRNLATEMKDIGFAQSQVSRRHALISYRPLLGWLLEDLNSTNGSWVFLNSYSKMQ